MSFGEVGGGKERAVWELQHPSPGALLLPSLATVVIWESDQRLGVIRLAHSCHTVTTTGRPRDPSTEGERESGWLCGCH